jgi:heme-degrading monooxygenase HmoA
MQARVTMISGSPNQAEEGIANFRDNVVPTIKEMGGHGGVLLIDRESGKAMAITLWEDEAAMRASEERANELRRTASDELGAAEQPHVERYEVAVFEKS